ncbi:hypothetical protein D3C72_2076490 [compost metagenome]
MDGFLHLLASSDGVAVVGVHQCAVVLYYILCLKLASTCTGCSDWLGGKSGRGCEGAEGECAGNQVAIHKGNRM